MAPGYLENLPTPVLIHPAHLKNLKHYDCEECKTQLWAALCMILQILSVEHCIIFITKGANTALPSEHNQVSKAITVNWVHYKILLW
jgi:hypothetical protein